MKYLKKFDKVDESIHDGMVNVIRNILRETYDSNNEATITDVINMFSDKLFINDTDREAFSTSIIGEIMEESLNESRIEDHNILPDEALKELEMYVDYKNVDNKIEVVEDPRVGGTYAVQVYRSNDDYTFHLLWNRGAYDEVEFDTFPPTSGDLKFF
jgi:hypothetical protein